MEKFMPINSPVTGEGRTSWRRDLPLGLPENFDYKNLRTRDDVFHLITTLPNSHRGHAAKMVYDHLGIIGRRLAYCAIMQAWEHDHTAVVSAFGAETALAAALRDVGPGSTGQRSIRVYRGTDHVSGAFGLSWTIDRNVACWFACRSPRNTPLVFTCELYPDDIVARHNKRLEHEIIVDPARFAAICVLLDDGGSEGVETYACDLVSYEDISPAAIASWRTGADRYGRIIEARTDLLRRRVSRKQ
jgi:hypothetical protein